MDHAAELKPLLEPIAGDNPTGIDLREQRTPEYVEAKEARNSARAAERAAMLDPENAGGLDRSWEKLLQLAPSVLTSQAKDLEVAVWYLEALVRVEGFAGLCTGISLLNSLVETFWENLFPSPDEDGLETKVAPLTGINGEGAEGTLIAPIRKLEITAPGTGSGEIDAFSYWHFHQAQEASNIADEQKRSDRYRQLGYSIDSIHQAVAASPDQFYIDLAEALETSIAQYKQLNDALNDHCGADAPPCSNINNILEEVLRAIRFLAKDKLVVASAAVPVTTAASSGAGKPPPAGSTGPLASRAAALKQLSEVAHYFRHTEPHTPMADGIDRIIRWGNMPVGLLMQELMPDANSRAVYTLLTGVEIGRASEPANIESINAEAALADIPTTSELPAQTNFSSPEENRDSGW